MRWALPYTQHAQILWTWTKNCRQLFKLDSVFYIFSDWNKIVVFVLLSLWILYHSLIHEPTELFRSKRIVYNFWDCCWKCSLHFSRFSSSTPIGTWNLLKYCFWNHSTRLGRVSASSIIDCSILLAFFDFFDSVFWRKCINQ